MDFDDPRWNGLLDGYRTPYDPRPALRQLEQGADVDEAWNELWERLHHQGDVGVASYAAIPHSVRIHIARKLADWNTYAMAAVIEGARLIGRNPKIPPWLREEYDSAWRQLVDLALGDLKDTDDETLVSSIVAVIALAKKQPTLGRMALLTEDERKEMLDGAGWG